MKTKQKKMYPYVSDAGNNAAVSPVALVDDS